jgi:hypothetical protein
MIAARIPRARILVVPTHIDECRNEEEIDLKCRSILTNMKEQRGEMARNIDAKSTRIKKTEGRCLPPKELAKVLEEHREQKDNLPVISLRYKVRQQRSISVIELCIFRPQCIFNNWTTSPRFLFSTVI